MKNRYVSIMLCAAMVFTVTACSNTVVNTSSEQETESAGTQSDLLSENEPEKSSDEAYAFGDVYDESRGPALLSVQTDRMYDYEWSDVFEQMLASYTYSTISLDETGSAAFPQLKDALDQLNEEKKQKVLENYDEILSYAKGEVSEKIDYFSTYETTENISVRRADTRVLSLLYDGFYYAGGAHGTYYYWGENFDTQTGKKLVLSDVITDMDALPELVQEQLDIYWGDVDFYDDLDLKEYFQDPDREISWTLDYNGITIYFNPYDIAPYASGVQNVTILFESHPELFEMQYQNAADRYAIQLSDENPFYYDLDNDGTEESILVYGSIDEYDTYTTQYIEINGHSFEDEINGYSIEPLFIHTADGTNYLYILNKLDNDWKRMTVFDLSTGDTEKVDVIFDSWHELFTEEPVYYATEVVITDPESFLLDTHTELLSTCIGSRPYQIGEDGLPVSDQDWYDINHPLSLKPTQPLEVTLVDETSGEELGETTVDAGTEVTYIRTDNEKYAWLRLPDGSVGRIEVEIRDWERYVGDVEINDLFDGIIFAG